MGIILSNYRKDALTVFFLLAFVYAYFNQDGGWNANSRFGLIFALVQEGRLSIDSYYDNEEMDTETGDLAYYNGHYYSDKSIGPAVLGALVYIPIYWLEQTLHFPNIDGVKWILTFLVVGFPSAIAGSFMFILCCYISNSRFRAYSITLAITLGTLYLPYSTIFFSHQLTSALLFSAFFFIFLLKENPLIWKNGYLFLIGLLLGWALICEYPSAIIIMALIVYYLSIIWKNAHHRKLSSIVWPMLGGIIPVFLQLLYNKLCFNNYFSIGYANLEDPIFNLSMGQGLMGIHWPNLSVLYYMTLHPLMGIFWLSPVLLFSFIGAFFIIKELRYRQEGLLAAWIICSYLIIMSGYYYVVGRLCIRSASHYPDPAIFLCPADFHSRETNRAVCGIVPGIDWTYVDRRSQHSYCPGQDGVENHLVGLF